MIAAPRSVRRHLAGWSAVALLASVAAVASGAPVTAAATPTDGSRAQAPFADPWWYEAMGLDEVHTEVSGEGVTIALLDDGLQRDAPALRGADIELMDSPCLSRGGSVPVRATYEDGPRSVHGTAMASLIVGGGEGPDGPGTGIRGSAPDARLLFFDVDDVSAEGSADGLRCDQRFKAQTFEAAVEAGADIISVSNGGDPELFIPPVIEEIVERNEVLVVASNNDTSPRAQRSSPAFITPSGVPGVLSVNAMDREAQPWEHSLTLRGSEDFSTEGWYAPAVMAAGVDLPVPGAWVGAGADEVQTGTSPATALAAGVMALVKERYPEATPNQLVQHAIHYTSRVRGGTNDLAWRQDSGFGLIAAPEMLTRDPGSWPDENPLLVQPEEIAERYPMSLGDRPADEVTSPDADADASANTAADAVPRTTEAEEDTEAGVGTGSSLWVGGIAALVLVAVAAYVWTRRRRTVDAEVDPDDLATTGPAPAPPHDDRRGA